MHNVSLNSQTTNWFDSDVAITNRINVVHHSFKGMDDVHDHYV